MDYYSEEQIALRELRQAAYHEAGHKMICERFGGAGDAVIWRNENRAPDEAAWRGQFRMYACPEVMHRAWGAIQIQAAPLPVNWKVLYGMAGLLAEELLSGDTDDDTEVITYDVYMRISRGEASSSDLSEMGIQDIRDFDLSYEVVGEGLRLLREMWAKVEAEAEWLIANALLDVR
jgi:hypothetical protein